MYENVILSVAKDLGERGFSFDYNSTPDSSVTSLLPK
jgi:hypothetical protein